MHRTQAGPFFEEDAISLAELEAERGDGRAEELDHLLLPTDAAVEELPELTLPEATGFYFQQGQAVMDLQVYRIGDEGDMVRVFQKRC